MALAGCVHAVFFELLCGSCSRYSDFNEQQTSLFVPMAEKPDLSPSSVPTFTRFTILEAKDTYPYVIPSFPVVTVNLRHIKYQMMDEGGDIHVFDGFMRECPAMHRTFPAIAEVGIGYKFAFFVEVRNLHPLLWGTYCYVLPSVIAGERVWLVY